MAYIKKNRKLYSNGVIMKAKLISLLVLVPIITSLLTFQCIAQDNILRLEAPKELLELWKQWNGKYVMYVHKEAAIKRIKDMHGMVLMVAFIESNDILDDGVKFSKKSGLKLKLMLQNNPQIYDKQFLEKYSSIGMMVVNVAKHYEFDSNVKLSRIEFK